MKEQVVGQSRKKCLFVSFGAGNRFSTVQNVHSGDISLEKCEMCPLK